MAVTAMSDEIRTAGVDSLVVSKIRYRAWISGRERHDDQDRYAFTRDSTRRNSFWRVTTERQGLRREALLPRTGRAAPLQELVPMTGLGGSCSGLNPNHVHGLRRNLSHCHGMRSCDDVVFDSELHEFRVAPEFEDFHDAVFVKSYSAGG